MGRTLPRFSRLIEHERRAWTPFKRALRKADQAACDRLFDCAKLHVQAGVYLSRPWSFEVIAMAILLEHRKRLERLLARIEEVEVRLSGEARGWPSTCGGSAAQAGVEPSEAPCFDPGPPPPVLAPPERVCAVPGGPGGAEKSPSAFTCARISPGGLPKRLETTD